MSQDTNTIRIITSEEEGYDLTVHIDRGRLLRSQTWDSPAEYAEDTVNCVVDEDGRRLTDSEVNALGLTEHDLMNLQEYTLK